MPFGVRNVIDNDNDAYDIDDDIDGYNEKNRTNTIGQDKAEQLVFGMIHDRDRNLSYLSANLGLDA